MFSIHQSNTCVVALQSLALLAEDSGIFSEELVAANEWAIWVHPDCATPASFEKIGARVSHVAIDVQKQRAVILFGDRFDSELICDWPSGELIPVDHDQIGTTSIGVSLHWRQR
ncbi:hypothetical protein [Stieleria maiorica]|uniref:hypothetical protein n=1 Tax=Stieleria maiorica TaxID=2795974 RepID=UPI0011CA6B3D|nr:hypothetical protein [Stieleria maiorica]